MYGKILLFNYCTVLSWSVRSLGFTNVTLATCVRTCRPVFVFRPDEHRDFAARADFTLCTILGYYREDRISNIVSDEKREQVLEHGQPSHIAHAGARARCAAVGMASTSGHGAKTARMGRAGMA